MVITNNFKIILGTFIRKKRKEKGLTQSDLAARLGNNYQNISRLECGETSPTLEWCFKLAKALDLTIEEFVAELVRFQKGK